MSLSRHSRAMLLNVLWHHQGGSSPVGHPIRKILGIEPHARLTNEELSEAKWIDELLSGSVALAEQNEKQRAFLEFAWKDIQMNEYAFKILEHVMNLPNLATPPVSEDRKDAERYLWLRASDFDIFGSPHAIHLSGKELDQAIDAAMYGEVK